MLSQKLIRPTQDDCWQHGPGNTVSRGSVCAVLRLSSCPRASGTSEENITICGVKLKTTEFPPDRFCPPPAQTFTPDVVNTSPVLPSPLSLLPLPRLHTPPNLAHPHAE